MALPGSRLQEALQGRNLGMIDLSVLALLGLAVAGFLLLILVILTFRGRTPGNATPDKHTPPREL